MTDCLSLENMERVSSTTGCQSPQNIQMDSSCISTSIQGHDDEVLTGSPTKKRKSWSDSVNNGSHKIPSLLGNFIPASCLNTDNLSEQSACLPLHTKCFQSIVSPRDNVPVLKDIVGNSRKRALNHWDELVALPSIQISRPLSSHPDADRARRFRRTADALKKCGLWEIALKSGDLMQKNWELQKDINSLKRDTFLFLRSVMQNIENVELRKYFFSNYQDSGMDNLQPSIKAGISQSDGRPDAELGLPAGVANRYCSETMNAQRNQL